MRRGANAAKEYHGVQLRLKQPQGGPCSLRHTKVIRHMSMICQQLPLERTKTVGCFQMQGSEFGNVIGQTFLTRNFTGSITRDA
jgi:hypothetical protein